MDASHLELNLSTGSPVILVFHTLSEGNAGHLVPGKSNPAAGTGGPVVVVVGDGIDVVVTTGAAVAVVTDVVVVVG
jgi:hypothetical protein